MKLSFLDRLFLIILVLIVLRTGLEILKRWLAGKPIFPEDQATATFTCPNCNWTLFYGLEKCDSCGMDIDQDEAWERTVIRFIVNRAIARGNTLFTASPAGLLLLGLSVFAHIVGYTFQALLLLPVTLIYTASVAAWSYRYADLDVAHAGFCEVQKKMKSHLHLWLAATSVQIILLILFW